MTEVESLEVKRSNSVDVCFEKNNYNFMVKTAVKSPLKYFDRDVKLFDSKKSQ